MVMRSPPNIILIIIDTLRKDYAVPLERSLTKLGFISYDNAIAPSPWTIPNHASIFTGLYPAFHGAHETKEKKVLIRLSTSNILTTQLKKRGYKTYLFTSNQLIHPDLGFGDFDYVYNIWPLILSPCERIKLEELREVYQLTGKIPLAFILLRKGYFKLFIKACLEYIGQRGGLYYILYRWPKDKGSRKILKILRKLRFSKHVPKFIFMNLTEVHEPYFIFDSWSKDFKESLKRKKMPDPNLLSRWKKGYSEEVSYITKNIVELMSVFREKGLFNNSLIIVTSDHGQLLGEYGRLGHWAFLYDELLRVPLLIKYPKGYKIKQININLKYISLVRLKHIILDIVDGRFEGNIPYENTVFAESYGLPINIKPSNEEERKNIEELEKYRIAIYHKNYKAIFNVSDWKFEEVISFNDAYVDHDIVKEIKKEVIKFLRFVTKVKSLKHLKMILNNLEHREKS